MDTNTQTTNGASNASDFQPPTGNPQQASPSLQSTQNLQQDGGVPGSQEQFNQNTATPLQVTTAEASSTTIPATVVTSSGSNFWPGFSIFLILLIAVALLYRRWNVYGEPTATEAPIPVAEAVVAVKAKKKKSPNKTPKKKGKKKSKT